MKAIIISQNVILNSISEVSRYFDKSEHVILLSTQKLFDFEKEIIDCYLTVDSYISFADLLTDKDMEWCDIEAFRRNKKKKYSIEDLTEYYETIKTLKNVKVKESLLSKYDVNTGFVCADDLGIEKTTWIKHGFKYVKLRYYFDDLGMKQDQSIKDFIKNIKPIAKMYRKTKSLLGKNKRQLTDEVYVSYWKEKKYVFIGSLNKTEYRMDMKWSKSEDEFQAIKRGQYETSEKCTYLSSIHEMTKCNVPDKDKYSIYILQDGYLPPNYSSLYLRFVQTNVKFYVWDKLGMQIFKNQGIPVEIMPFRKRLYLPEPRIVEIKKILVVTSGAGDWTAIKNRSDEDVMVEAFGRIARLLPQIEFIYRCHPAWVHPKHQGVHSIKRVAEYYERLGLPNIKVSSNIESEDLNDFKLSLPRQSMEEDLKNTDMVIGEHSIAMIDGAFKGIPFASLNLSGRRDLFCGITELGFPHFEDVDELVDFIKGFSNSILLQKKYKEAVNNYNRMTDDA